MLIRLDQFAGMRPGLAPHLLPVNAAQTATDCKMVNGALASWKALSATINDPAKVGTIKSIFLYENQYWFHWLTDVDCVYGAIAQDAWRRVYWTGDSAPKMTVVGVSVAGPDYPTASYLLGIPAPASSPTTVTAGTPDEPQDETLFEDRAYVVTYVSAYGEEGPPCTPTATLTWKPGETVTLSSLPGAPSGNHNITNKKIYRTNTGSNDTAYQLVRTATYPTGLIPVSVTSVSDSCASDSLGAVLPSAEWDPPPANLSGLIALPNGSLCGFVGKEVCFSVPYYPHAWPLSYRIPVDAPVVSLGAFGTSILVTTQGMPYLLTGESPEAMGREKLETGQACVSKRGTVDMGYAVIYPAPDGLIMAGTGQPFSLATAGVLGRDEWQALNPSSIHAYHYAGDYIGFYTTTGNKKGGFVFNPNTGDFSLITTYATAGYSDLATGKLYLVVDGLIVQWDAGAAALPYTWKSRPYYAAQPGNMGAAMVYAGAYPVTMKVTADGTLKHTQSVADALPFRLPGGYEATKWEIELSGTPTVNMVFLASTVGEMAG